MKRWSPTVLVLAALVVIVLVAPALERANAVPHDPTSKLKWGVLLQTTRPFYSVGQTARAIYVIYNYSAQNAYGWTSVVGGNGCQYRFTIEDDLGRIVWEPGAIVEGHFLPIFCLAIVDFKDLPSGSRLNKTVDLDLIYKNGSGIGTLGDPLPAGVYQVNVTVWFNGPQRAHGSTAPGMNYTAAVPIRIE